jgi:hypothetical protein
MNRLLLIVVAFGLAPRAAAQTFPVVRGAIEFEAGIAGIVLPEDSAGTFSAQPTGRIGYFVAEGFEAQVEGSVRVWPLGSVAAHSVSASGNLLWYPSLGPKSRNLYLLGGAGMASTSPPEEDTTWDPLARGGIGYKVPLSGKFVNVLHFTAEFRGEYLLKDPADFVAGALLSLSYFR